MAKNVEQVTGEKRLSKMTLSANVKFKKTTCFCRNNAFFGKITRIYQNKWENLVKKIDRFDHKAIISVLGARHLYSVARVLMMELVSKAFNCKRRT